MGHTGTIMPRTKDFQVLVGSETLINIEFTFQVDIV